MSNNENLIGKKILIIGLSNPISITLGDILTKLGCQLHLADTSDKILKESATFIKKQNGITVEIHPTDLSEQINIAVLALECEDVDIIINTFNTTTINNVHELEYEQWRDHLGITLYTAMNIAEEFLENIDEQKNLVIVNVGSKMKKNNDENIGAVVLNGALVALSEALNNKVKSREVRVISFIPETGTSEIESATALVNFF